MLTQAELLSSEGRKVVWVYHNRYEGQEVKVGNRIVLNEEPSKVYTVGRTFLSLADESCLPTKSRKGTIFCYIEDERDQAEADIAAEYPRVCVA